MIPKVLHLYWGRNKPLSFLRAMTVHSFLINNPDWIVNIYTPEKPNFEITWKSREHQLSFKNDFDCFDNVCKLPDVNIYEIKDGTLPNCSEVQRSDLLRWFILANKGGYWSDFDIFYIKPINFDAGNNVDVVGAWQKGIRENKIESIGFLGSSGNDFAKSFYNSISIAEHQHLDGALYQSAGRFSYAPVLKNHLHDQRVMMLDPEVVYPVSSWEVCRLYDTVTPVILSDNTIGIHWYGGHKNSQIFENSNLEPSDAWLCKFIWNYWSEFAL